MSDEIKTMFIRLPIALHADLVEMAQEEDRSLHKMIVFLLKAAVIAWKARRVAA